MLWKNSHARSSASFVWLTENSGEARLQAAYKWTTWIERLVQKQRCLLF